MTNLLANLAPQLHDGLSVIELLLSLAMLVVAWLLWREQSGEQAGTPSSGIPNDLRIQLADRIRRLQEISAQFDAVTLVPLRKAVSAEERRLAGVLDTFRAWASEARKVGLTSGAKRQIQDHEDRLATLLERLDSRPSGRVPGQLAEQVDEAIQNVVLKTIDTSDRYIDMQRVNTALQAALESFVGSAEMELIDPRRGSPYRRKGETFDRKVESVMMRGVRYRSGPILHDPEFKDFR